MPEITLGDTTVPVYPERHARLSRKLGPAFVRALSRGEGIDADKLMVAAGDGAYDALAALISNLEKKLPRYRFMGYPSQTAYDAGEYDEDLDEWSPSLPEIKEAFVVALRVNGLTDIGEALGKVIDSRLVKAQINRMIATSISSPSSQLTSGESASTSSGTSLPTSTESEGSLSPASEV